MVCWPGRELRNTTLNFLVMFELNHKFSSFKKPSNPTCIEEMPPESEEEAGARLDAERIERQRIQNATYSFESFDALKKAADGLAGISLEARSQDSETDYQPVDYEIKSPCDDGDLACYESNPVWQQQQRDKFKQFEIEWRKPNANAKNDMNYFKFPSPESKQCQCGFDPDCGLAPWQDSGSQSITTSPLEAEVANVI